MMNFWKRPKKMNKAFVTKNIERLKKSLRQQRLAYSLVLYVILCSSVFTLLATAIQLYVSYRSDLDFIEEDFDFLEQSYVPAISVSLYKIDIEQLKLQLDGVLQLHDMIYVEVEEPRGLEVFRISDGDPNADADMTRIYPLTYKTASGEVFHLGTIKVSASFKGVYDRLIDRIVIVLVTNAAKTFPAAICILLIFYYFFTSHISKIAKYIRGMKPDAVKPPLALDRKKPEERKPDELDDLVFSINLMLQSMKGYDNNKKHTEKVLRSSEAKLRAFIDNTADMICARDRDGALIFWNEAFNKSCKRLFGVEAHVGLKTGDLVPPEQREKTQHIRELWRRVFKGERIRGEFAYTWPNGENHFFETSWSPIQIGDEIIGAAEITRDITKRKLAEQKVKLAEQRYRTVADFTYDWEYWESSKGEILYVSPSCERISGYPPEAFVNNPDLIQEIILSEDKRVWTAHTHQATSKSGPLVIVFRIRTREGEVRWIEHACQPVSDAEGTFLGFRASNRDITSRKLAEEELQRKDRMLEDAQRIARLGSWDWDILTNKLKWSDEVFRIFGLSSHNFGATYETFLQSVHPEDREDVKAAVNLSLTDPSAIYNIMHRIKRPDGSERIVRERAKVIFDDNTGKAWRMIGTVQDITDIREMETEAEQLRSELSRMDRVNMMGVLTAGIAHEINQPLAAILSNAQASLRFLNSDPQELEEVEEALRDIISDDKRAGEMVHSIRNIARKYDLKHEEIDLNETAREVLPLVKSEALNRKILMLEDLQPDIPPVNGDRIQIQQVILNLVMNALEALKGHNASTPKVILSTRFVDNKQVILSVSDSGPGIEPERLNTIFDSFATTKEGGMGIGLSICRSIAEKLGGRLWAENRPEGGAIFFLSLPLSG
jgi:PAS domain S-box-containing protein